MATFTYKARTAQGTLTTGELPAANEKEARAKIRELGLYVTEVKEKGTSFDFASLLKPKVKTEDLMVFTGQLEAVYSVGVPLLKGLKFIADQTENSTLKEALNQIIADVSEGRDLSFALAKQNHIFDHTYQSLLVAGEATGELQNILKRIAEIIETKMENTNKIKSALFYPKMVIGFLVLVFFVSVYLIIPKMQGFYKNMKIELPGITKFMLALSELFTSGPFILGLVVAISAFIYFRKKILDNYLLDIHTYMLKIPVIGPLILEVEMSSFCTVLGILLRNGVQLVEGLRITRGVLTNLKVASVLEISEGALKEGGTLAESLKKSEIFPKILVNFIAIGEESGNLESILEKMSTYYKAKVSNSLGTFSKLIEPVLLFVIFGAVLALALAVFMPMWKMTSAANPMHK